MNFYCSQKIPQLVSCLSLCGALQLVAVPMVGADTTPPPTPTTPVGTPAAQKAPATADAHDFLTVANTRRAFKMPLDLTIENASMKDVVARVEKVLATRKEEAPVPPIEVRGVRPVRLSFAVKGSTVGDVLSAAARLAGARLYFFGGYVLLAPANALLPDEVALASQGLSNDWLQTNYFSDKGSMAKRSALTTFIAKDMGGVPTDWGAETSPTTRSKAMKVSELSPNAQAMLKELVANMNEFAPKDSPSSSSNRIFPFILSPDTEVTLSLGNSIGPSNVRGARLNLDSPGKNSHLNWELNGNGTGWGGSGGTNATKPSLSPSAPPFDPSAGKS